jgi:hypothetical protein
LKKFAILLFKTSFLVIMFAFFSGCDLVDALSETETEVFSHAQESSVLLLSTVLLKVSPPSVTFNLVKFADAQGHTIPVYRAAGRYTKSYQFPPSEVQGYEGSKDKGIHFLIIEPGYYAIADIRNNQGEDKFYSAEIEPVDINRGRFLAVWGVIYAPLDRLAYVGDIHFTTYTGRLTVEHSYNTSAAQQFVSQHHPNLMDTFTAGGYYASGYSYQLQGD